MLNDNILRYLERGIEIVCESKALPCVVLRPNASRDVADAALVFAIDAQEVRARRDTEASAVTTCVGVVVASCDANVGGETVDAAATALVDLFARDASRTIMTDRVVREELFPTGVRIARVYPRAARRSVGTLENGRYRTTVWIELEIEEELNYGGNE